MSRELVARFVLQLRDQVSGPLRGLRASLEGLRSVAGRVGLGGVAAGFALAPAVREAAALDVALRETAVTAGLLGDEARKTIADLRLEMRELGRAGAQTPQAFANTLRQLVSANVALDEARRMLPTLGRAADATRAQMADLGNAAVTLRQNLRLPEGQLEEGLASLAHAGMEGRFELRAMAQYAPTVGTAMAGVFGPLIEREGMARRAIASMGAFLQIARRVSGTDEQAAVGVRDFLSKISSEEVVKAMRERGVDMLAVLRDAREVGRNPAEAGLREVLRATGGDAFEIGRIFTDNDSRNFVVGMAQNLREYLRIRDEAAKASGGVFTDALDVMREGPQFQLDRLTGNLQQLGERAGQSAARGLEPLNNQLERLNAWIDGLDKSMPGAIDKVAQLGAEALGLAAVLGRVFGPAGAVAGVVAAGALAVWRHWDELKGRWEGLMGGLRGPAEDAARVLQGVWELPGRALDAFVNGVAEAVERVRRAWEQTQAMFRAGQAAGAAGAAGPVPLGSANAMFGGRGALPGWPVPRELAGPPPPWAREPAPPVHGEFRFILPPNVRLEGGVSNAPQLRIVTPDGGATRGRQ